jgi:hypothetical protein
VIEVEIAVILRRENKKSHKKAKKERVFKT